jgi:hypothetical protein
MAANWLATLLAGEQVTYRQADYWIRRHPDLFSAGARDIGTGNERQPTLADIRVLRLMARLVTAGFTPSVAAKVVANLNDGECVLSEHVTVRMH